MRISYPALSFPRTLSSLGSLANSQGGGLGPELWGPESSIQGRTMWPVGPLQRGPETSMLGTPGSIEKGGCARDSPKALVSPFWPNGHGSLLHMNQKMVNLRRMDLKLDSSGTPTVCEVWGGAQP